MVVLAGRLLREAVLQQSSLSANRRLLRRGEDGRAAWMLSWRSIDRCEATGRRRCPGCD